jgi:hypothetical protein
VSEQAFFQGSADMLCGIYCAARLIACHKVRNNAPSNQLEFYESSADAAFFRLMVSVEECNYLTAKKIACPDPKKGGGFKDMQLQRVFNRLDKIDREGLTAIAFSSARIKALKGSECRKILDNGAYAVVNQSGENHWITIEGKHRDGGYYSYDPSEGGSIRSVPQIGWSKGLFVADPEVLKF